MTKYVYDFSEGNKDMKDLLGGKGANLAEMTNMGLPVPHGFTITTEACLTYLAEGGHPAGLMEEVDEHLAALEASMGKTLGDAGDPLLVSVRSGAKFSMPGMMDTVLNLGLNEASVAGLAAQTGDDLRFARDAYRRFIQMFGKIVMDVPADAFEHALEEAKQAKGPDAQDTDLDAEDLSALIERFLAIYREHTGFGLPDRAEGAAAPRDRGGLQELERQARARLPPAEQDQRRPGHGGERGRDGVRQPRRRLRHRRRVHARSVDRRARPLRRLPGQRAGRGRGGRDPQHPAAREARGARPRVVQGAARGDGHARGALPRHVRHRVHDREGASVDPADARRQAHGVRRVGDGQRHARARA